MKHVLITCTGRAGQDPHNPVQFARLNSVLVDGAEQWEEQATSSHAYRMAFEQMMKDNPRELGMVDPEVDTPRQRITVDMTADGVPVPTDVDGFTSWWSDRIAYTKYEVECRLCGLNLSQRAEKVWPKLSAATREDHVSHVLLRDLI